MQIACEEEHSANKITQLPEYLSGKVLGVRVNKVGGSSSINTFISPMPTHFNYTFPRGEVQCIAGGGSLLIDSLALNGKLLFRYTKANSPATPLTSYDGLTLELNSRLLSGAHRTGSGDLRLTAEARRTTGRSSRRHSLEAPALRPFPRRERSAEQSPPRRRHHSRRRKLRRCHQPSTWTPAPAIAGVSTS